MTIKRLKETKTLSNNDHGFAKWLKDNGWTGKTESDGDTNCYYNDKNEIIAKALFNNSKCTYRIFCS